MVTALLSDRLLCILAPFSPKLVACRFMITQHPEVEAKVLAELASLGLMPTVNQPNPRAMEYDDIAKLTFTTNAIKVPPGRSTLLL